MRFVSILLAVSIAAPSCTQRREAPEAAAQPSQATTTSATQAPANAPAAVNVVVPLDDMRFLDSAAIGEAIGADGMVQTEVTTLQRGKPIYASVRAKEVPAGLVARVVWLDGKGKQIAMEQLPLPQDTRFVTFQAKNAKRWKPGNYRVELWLGGDKVYDTEFKVVR